jgi:hypothetical protein
MDGLWVILRKVLPLQGNVSLGMELLLPTYCPSGAGKLAYGQLKARSKYAFNRAQIGIGP